MYGTIHLFKSIAVFVEPFLKNLDPALFQNVIIGILVIFIPIVIVFLQEKNTDSLRRTAIKKEVLKINYIFIFSISSIFLFAIYNNFGLILRTGLLIIAFILVYFLIKGFFKLLNFSPENIFEYERNYLKKLSIEKTKNYLIDAYQSLWQRQIIFSNEEVFTGIFILHIDDAINIKKYELASQLAKIYVKNINERDTFLLVGKILPKVLGWSEEIWKDQYNPEWLCFGSEFFQEIIKTSLKDPVVLGKFFSVFKKYMEEIEVKMNEIENKEEKEKYGRYITGLFESFFPIFFSEIKNAPSSYSIWENYFPKEWKISMENVGSRVPKIILQEFLVWSQGRMSGKDYDETLGTVIRGIFPNIHAVLFTAFLRLNLQDIKTIIEEPSNFYISGVVVTRIASIGSKESASKEIRRAISKTINLQQKETIQIILDYFFPWPATYSMPKDDLIGEEFENFRNSTEVEKESIVKSVRKEKIEKLKKEIERIKIDEDSKDFEQKQNRKTTLLELVNLLLSETKSIK